MEKKVLDVQVGMKGFVSFGGENCNQFRLPATVIVVYEDVFHNPRFAVLTDFGNCQSVNSGFDKFGFVQFEGQVLFQFEVTE